ncbi:MAG TPA: amino acid permease [Candidatus Thermoplasmatota archaeon]|nr:amino acid permease [Candidatus Thermoplasmatota archaeon]
MPGALRRELGLASAVAVVVGSMIGVGIFVGPTEIAPLLPSPGLVLLAWVLGGLLIFCGALSFAELGAALPESGGPYAYMREAYGRFVAFLTGWTGFSVGKAASTSALAVATSAVKLGAIAALVLGGVALLSGNAPALASERLVPAGGSLLDYVPAFGLALIPVFFAYDGWSNSTQVAEEVRDPGRNVPRSLILGTLAVGVAYTLATLVYFLALGSGGVAEDGAAARAAARLVGPVGATLIVAAILVSITGTVNAVTLSGPRIAFAMARDGVFPRRVERISRWGTPAWSIVLQSAISVALVLVPPIGDRPLFSTLLDYIVFDSFVFYALGAAAVIVLRRRRPELARPYKVPLYPWVPLVFVLGSVAFLLNTLLTRPLEALGGLAIIAAGLPVYFLSARAGTRPGRG